MTTKIRTRPHGSAADFRALTDSIITLFPHAVKSAACWVTDPNGEGMRDFLYKQGATQEGLLEAIRFYSRYFETSLEHRVKKDPFEAFQEAGMQAGDPSFIAFQSVVAGALMSLYHDIAVDLAGEVIAYSEGWVDNAKGVLDDLLAASKASEP